MAIARHRFNSPAPDVGGPNTIKVSHWNDSHIFVGGTDGQILVSDSVSPDGVKWGNLLDVNGDTGLLPPIPPIDAGYVLTSANPALPNGVILLPGPGLSLEGGLISLEDNGVSNAKFRDSLGLSVLGRALDSSGDPDDIVAGTDGHTLRRSGTSLGFGPLDLSNPDATTGLLPGDKVEGGGGGGGTVTDVLWVGPEAPTDTDTELWADTDMVLPSGAVLDTLWEGPTPPEDPRTELWADTTVTTSQALYPFVPFTPFSTTGWTWVNQGTASVVESNNIVFATLPAASANAIRGQVKALPAGTPTITSAVIPVLWSTTQSQAGIALRESATDKWVALFMTGYVSGLSLEYHKHTTATTQSTATSIGVLWSYGAIFYLRFQITATQYVGTFSLDGINFMPFLTENKNTFFTTAPDQIGWAMKCQQTTRAIGCSYVSWKET